MKITMNEFNENLVEDDEISLLDFITVLIKHRLLIIWGTITVFVITAAYLFIYPMIVKSADKHNVKIQYSYHVSSMPVDLETDLGFENSKVILDLAVYNLNRLPLLSDEIKEFKPFDNELDKLSPYEYNRFIQNLVSKKNYKAEASKLGNELILEFSVPEHNVGIANRMIEDMIKKTESAIEDYIFPKLDTLEKNVNQSLSDVSDSLSNSSTLIQKKKDTQVLIQNFRSTYNGFIKINGEPFILLEPLGRLKKFIIIVFAAFFVFVFAAFVLNTIDNIKQDPEASQTIKEAWDGGKISRKK